MESDDWVRNKQTVEIGFYEIDTKGKGDKYIANLYFKAWNNNIRLPSGFLFPCFAFVLRKFWRKHLTPYAHVNIKVYNMIFDTYVNFSGWIPEDSHKKRRHKKLSSVELPMNNYPSYDEVMKLTDKFKVLEAGPFNVAYLIMMMIFPLEKLGYPPPSNNCVDHTRAILKLFGTEIEGAWTPSSFFEKLTEAKECQITWTSSNNLS